MIIAIDIDGTLTDQHVGQELYAQVLTRKGIPFRIDATKCNYRERFGVSEEIDEYVFLRMADELFLAPPRPGAAEVINGLKAAGHTIYFITGRPADATYRSGLTAKSLTESVLTANDIQYDDLFFTTSKGSKCKELGVDVVIEDEIKYVKDIHTENPNTKILIMDADYNREIDFPVTRVSDWKDVARALELVSKEESEIASLRNCLEDAHAALLSALNHTDVYAQQKEISNLLDSVERFYGDLNSSKTGNATRTYAVDFSDDTGVHHIVIASELNAADFPSASAFVNALDPFKGFHTAGAPLILQVRQIPEGTLPCIPARRPTLNDVFKEFLRYLG